MANKKEKLNRRQFLKQSAVTTAAVAAGLGTSKSAYAGKKRKSPGKKVIVIGLDGMDPRLAEKMMAAGKLSNLAKLNKSDGYRQLGTSVPPLSPVAWANFITGAGPGKHGIFDFMQRYPDKQHLPVFSIAGTSAGSGYWEVGEHKLQLDFWPFSHKPAETLLLRQGVPFWDYLDKAGIESTFYDLPSNYPASPSKYGHHRCLSGMGTPDMTGNYGGYQHFAEDGPIRPKDEGGCRTSMLFFEDEKAAGTLVGPPHTLLKEPQPATVDFTVHRDTKTETAVIEMQDHKILLKKGQWSDWLKVEFELSMPWFAFDTRLSGICRFYLQEVGPNFRLYVTPINVDPSKPAIQLTEPSEFIEEISDELGMFYTAGFQEDHKALSTGIFSDSEYAVQADMVLEERLNLLNYAVENYDDGLLFFYFSSTDMQSHMFWWDSEEKHPTRSASDAKKYFKYLQGIYTRLDTVVGDILKRYGDEATVIVMSDHGFANFKRQFNLNTWLRENGYLQPADATSLMTDVDWQQSRAYGIGINGLYLNLKGREKFGTVEPGAEKEKLIAELINKLEAITDENGQKVILKVYRADKAYQGPFTAMAPDLIVGYARGYRASWDTCMGGMSKEILSDNDSPWAADHGMDAAEVPGVLFSNRPIAMENPSLIDLAPSILTEFGLKIPSSMEGKNVF